MKRIAACLTVAVLATLSPAFAPAPVTAGVQRHAGTWSRGAAMPFVRSYLAAVAGPAGRIYAIGGEGHAGKPTKTVQAYDLHTGQWTLRAPMPIPSAGPIAATVDGKIYVVGASGKIQVYDPGRDTWRIVGSLPPHFMASAAVAGPGSTIYMIGQVPHTDLEIFDTRTHTWTRRASKPREQFGGAVASGPGGRLYDAAGATYRLNNVVSIEVYDPAANRWSYKARIPTARYAPAAATGPDGSIYVLGGVFVAGTGLRTVEAYDPRTNRWITKQPMSYPRSYFAAVWGPDGKLYAVGAPDTASQPSVEVYTP